MARDSRPYWEKLRDPRWQRRRLDIFNRAGFACEECGSKDRTLNVHHKRYKKGKEPWEYEDHELQSLCEACHHDKHEIETDFLNAMEGLGDSGARRVRGYAFALAVMSNRFAFPDECPVIFSTLDGTIGACDAAGVPLSEAERLSGTTVPAAEFRRMAREHGRNTD